MSELVVTHHPKGGWAFFVGVEGEPCTLRVERDGRWVWYDGEQPAKVTGGALRLPGWASSAIVLAEEQLKKLEVSRRRREAEEEEEQRAEGRLHQKRRY